MYVSQELVFSELQKTGCSHIRHVLGTYLDGRKDGKHNAPPDAVISDSRLKVGSVRNPWEWYVSLFAYGCDGRGQLWRATTQRNLRTMGWGRKPIHALRYTLNQMRIDTAGWARLYRDASDVGAFRAWMARIHDPAFFIDMQEGLAFQPAARQHGLMTTRFIHVFCSSPEALLSQPALEADHIDTACFVDVFVRNEAMEAGLAEIFARLNRPEITAETLAGMGRTNTSSRARDWRGFYDAATRDLVARRDAYVIQRFGYTAPELGV